jgi:hypothetical protein
MKKLLWSIPYHSADSISSNEKSSCTSKANALRNQQASSSQYNEMDENPKLFKTKIHEGTFNASTTTEALQG